MVSTANDEQGKRRKLVGCENFVRHNPHSDKFGVHRFHHVEFYTADATMTYKRLQHGLGMTLVAKSDLGSGNSKCTSFVLQSGSLKFVVTAPQSLKNIAPDSACPLPGYDAEFAYDFLRRHGLAARAIGLQVEDAAEAHRISTANGAISVAPPSTLVDKATGRTKVVSEVVAYGDVVMRFVSGDFPGPFLPGYEAVDAPRISYGLQRLDHAVGNVPRLFDVTDYLAAATGFHEFAEFTADDVGTLDSGLNSMVLANNNEFVLMPVNEPTFGTARKSQIQTYLEQNEGAGLQHLALKTNDIFATLREMQARSDAGGMEFMPKPPPTYYKALPGRIGDVLTAEQYREVEERGILVDRDDQGVLLQIFTKPIGDRMTLFFEIIQRIGCEMPVTVNHDNGAIEQAMEQAGGCGGFGKGNFKELFKSIEEYEKTLEQ